MNPDITLNREDVRQTDSIRKSYYLYHIRKIPFQNEVLRVLIEADATMLRGTTFLQKINGIREVRQCAIAVYNCNSQISDGLEIEFMDAGLICGIDLTKMRGTLSHATSL